jgi:hypothetical protein
LRLDYASLKRRVEEVTLNERAITVSRRLAVGDEGTIMAFMSAAELIKQVKALPARERRKLVKVILALEEEGSMPSAARMRNVKWPDVEARARRIFGDRVLPNLVLLEREEASS